MHVILQNRFRCRLSEAVRLSGLSQRELAERMGASPQYVTNYLKGYKGAAEPSLAVVERFAEALRIPPHALIDESDLAEFFVANV